VAVENPIVTRVRVAVSHTHWESSFRVLGCIRRCDRKNRRYQCLFLLLRRHTDLKPICLSLVGTRRRNRGPRGWRCGCLFLLLHNLICQPESLHVLGGMHRHNRPPRCCRSSYLLLRSHISQQPNRPGTVISIIVRHSSWQSRTPS
jgi:hypothetical protein